MDSYIAKGGGSVCLGLHVAAYKQLREALDGPGPAEDGARHCLAGAVLDRASGRTSHRLGTAPVRAELSSRVELFPLSHIYSLQSRNLYYQVNTIKLKSSHRNANTRKVTGH